MPAATRPSWWGGVVPTIVAPAVVAAVSLGGTRFAGAFQPAARPVDALAVVLLLVGPAALVVRRVRPPLALAVCVLALGAFVVAGYPSGPVPLATLVAVFTAVVSGWHRRAAAIVVTAVVLLVGTLLLLGRPIPWSGSLAWLAWLAVFAAAGALWRARRERIEQSRAVLAEEQRRRAGEERLRIAQDLHDVLGHHVSLINVQAGVALFLMDDDPEQARTALTEIKRSSRDLLREMRSTLGVLRGVDERAPHHPTPGLDRLEVLLDDVRAAGLPVTLTTEGAPRALPTRTDLAAYRIVQESLTNTRRHAGPARASVLLRHLPDALEIRIDDDGAGVPGEVHDGNGLVGMRERAHSLGGTLQTGPGPAGGFRVHARLPLDQGPAAGGAEPGTAAGDGAVADPAPGGDGPDTVGR